MRSWKKRSAKKLTRFIEDTEDTFFQKVIDVVNYIESHPKVRSVFVSGPTSSGKTTFTDRLVCELASRGHQALRLSLDDYYNVAQLHFDADGRPDYESIGTIDTVLAANNLGSLLAGELTVMAGLTSPQNAQRIT